MEVSGNRVDIQGLLSRQPALRYHSTSRALSKGFGKGLETVNVVHQHAIDSPFRAGHEMLRRIFDRSRTCLDAEICKHHDHFRIEF